MVRVRLAGLDQHKPARHVKQHDGNVEKYSLDAHKNVLRKGL